jgi:hypothetical protein
MTRQEALQRFYDYDRLGEVAFAVRHPDVVQETRAWLLASECYQIVNEPEKHVDIFIAERARVALATMLLVAS